MKMNLETLKKKWEQYSDEIEANDYVDIDKHVNMASKMGLMIKEIERLNEFIGHLEHENTLLYGRLNHIVALAGKEIK